MEEETASSDHATFSRAATGRPTCDSSRISRGQLLDTALLPAPLSGQGLQKTGIPEQAVNASREALGENLEEGLEVPEGPQLVRDLPARGGNQEVLGGEEHGERSLAGELDLPLFLQGAQQQRLAGTPPSEDHLPVRVLQELELAGVDEVIQEPLVEVASHRDRRVLTQRALHQLPVER